ncbi:MAG: hypothetical protein IRZ28_15805 [Steroidobacteraceae bacterium]|nr:hypothetical protein [Steroidobacteraceae bacterium]
MTLTSHVHKDATQLLIDTINATGGLLLRPDGTQAPLGDPDWLDLADAYLAACTEKGIDPVVTVDRESDDADKELSMSDDHQLIDKAALEPNNAVTAISTILETLCDLLADAARVGAEARDCIRHAERNRAIGTVLRVDSLRADARALYGAALVLHRFNPSASTSRSAAREHTTGVPDALVRLLDSADDTGCGDDLIVVRKFALREVAATLLEKELPEWLRGT